MKMGVLSGLKPEKVFYYFEELCKIPHGSYHTKQISDYLVQFAKERNLECSQDDSNNVVIRKAAFAGYEDAPVVILQGHCDMVCEKTADSTHDFEKDGLDLMIEGDYVTANGTTLGGDDGIAVAYALAILDDDTLKHPALEVVITTDEEVGLLGAKALDCSQLKGKYLINMDSEEEGYLWVSCAGGLSAITTIPVRYQEVSGEKYELVISGLNGGHSGAEIDKNRPQYSAGVREQVNINIKYQGYIRRQMKQVEQFKKMENKRIPKDINYDEVGSLRIEAVQKLKKFQPLSIGQASRISGVSPADISVLLVYLESRDRK